MKTPSVSMFCQLASQLEGCLFRRAGCRLFKVGGLSLLVTRTVSYPNNPLKLMQVDGCVVLEIPLDLKQLAIFQNICHQKKQMILQYINPLSVETPS